MTRSQTPKRPEWLVGLAIAVVATAAVLIILNLLGTGDDPSFEGGGADASGVTTDNVEFVLFDGSPARLADFRGTPVVLNFWASWCPACVAEMPDFQSVHSRLGDQVTFLGMNMQETSRPGAEALVAQTGVTYQLALDPDGAIYAGFGGIAMPTTVFIDAEGNVVDTHAGTIFADDLESKIREVFGL